MSVTDNYYVNRVGQALFTWWAVLTLSFALIRWMPGGPLDYIRSQLMTSGLSGSGGGGAGGQSEELERFNQLAQQYVNIQPDAPLHVQYYNWITDVVFHGDLGTSIQHSEPVMEILGPAIPWTVLIGIVGVFISFVSRVLIGGLMGYYEGSRFDFTATSLLVWGHALPYYMAAILMIYILGYQLEMFPTGGRVNSATTPGLNWPFIAGIMEHAALPILSVAWASLGAGAIAMRANTMQILGEDYMRVGRIRGLSTKRLTLFYVARNAVLPMYTRLMMDIGFMFGGTIILETVFKYYGLGYRTFQALQFRDYSVLMGAFIIITTAVVIALLIADLTYSFIDPRITTGQEEAF